MHCLLKPNVNYLNLSVFRISGKREDIFVRIKDEISQPLIFITAAVVCHKTLT